MTFHMWCWTSKWKFKREQCLQQMYSDFTRQMGKTGDWWKLMQYRPHLNSMNNPPLIKRPPPIQRGKNKIRGDQQPCCVPLTPEDAHILLLWVCNFHFSTIYIASLFSLQKKKKEYNLPSLATRPLFSNFKSFNLYSLYRYSIISFTFRNFRSALIGRFYIFIIMNFFMR